MICWVSKEIKRYLNKHKRKKIVRSYHTLLHINLVNVFVYVET